MQVDYVGMHPVSRASGHKDREEGGGATGVNRKIQMCKEVQEAAQQFAQVKDGLDEIKEKIARFLQAKKEEKNVNQRHSELKMLVEAKNSTNAYKQKVIKFYQENDPKIHEEINNIKKIIIQEQSISKQDYGKYIKTRIESFEAQVGALEIEINELRYQKDQLLSSISNSSTQHSIISHSSVYTSGISAEDNISNRRILELQSKLDCEMTDLKSKKEKFFLERDNISANKSKLSTNIQRITLEINGR